MYTEMDFSHNLQCAFAQNMVPLFLGLRPQKPEYMEGKNQRNVNRSGVCLKTIHQRQNTTFVSLLDSFFVCNPKYNPSLSHKKRTTSFFYTYLFFLFFLITDKHQISLLSHDPFFMCCYVF